MEIDRSSAHRRIVGSYRDAADSAAGENNVISRTEEKQLSPWAQDVVTDLRREGGRIGVERYVRAQAGRVSSALREMAGPDDRISREEANNSRAHPELKAKVLGMFPSDPIEPSTLGAVADDLNAKIRKLADLFSAMDDLENPTHLDAFALGAHASTEAALNALTQSEEGLHVRLREIPTADGNGLASFLQMLDESVQYALDQEAGTPESRSAYPVVKDAIREAFENLETKVYTGLRSDPYWFTTQNVLLGRTPDNQYIAMIHTSGMEN